ncbi:hypothetical protein [Streptomyces sp. LN325]|uniref:hypothetical protein n=1 Tax=Streptomyces sp. LN325 TaxID=3112976 RepID=UPI003717F159
MAATTAAVAVAAVAATTAAVAAVAATTVAVAATTVAVTVAAGGGNIDDGGRDGGGRGGRGYEGRIDFNERSYSAQSWGCITVVSGLGSRSFNVRNDSHRTVEVFRGATCDNGSPVATVGPWSTSNGVVSHFVHGGVKVRDGVVGSFRVVRDRHGW